MQLVKHLIRTPRLRGGKRNPSFNIATQILTWLVAKIVLYLTPCVLKQGFNLQFEKMKQDFL